MSLKNKLQLFVVEFVINCVLVEQKRALASAADTAGGNALVTFRLNNQEASGTLRSQLLRVQTVTQLSNLFLWTCWHFISILLAFYCSVKMSSMEKKSIQFPAVLTGSAIYSDTVNSEYSPFTRGGVGMET